MALLACIGIATIIIITILLIVCAIAFIKEGIDQCKRRHRIKHRFDKPPTAKCYCKDCIKHGEDGRCYKFERWLTADNWFCWDAEYKK